ncbi:MAG: glycosyltransferase family 4 protein [Ruminococcus sp.]|uniref:glycosyltransferase family 4 protein n=1 Tax=Ruminococcus sp. TaxID=41978 RepID=UPI0025DDE385|nr:glycosyltransferase family 4 protein [Ruminococcus sp.]MCR5600121.1 glycosyltransferase family 4 protein [Ruminococcus sp.]
MNILFLTYGNISDINEHSIYCDLLREFIRNGHKVHTVSAGDHKNVKSEKYMQVFVDMNIARCSSNLFKKGLSALSTESRFANAVKKYYHDVEFDLVLYTTPPITLFSAVRYVKKRDNAFSYLMLKDIFPQNAVDIGMMSTTGAKGFIYRLFKDKEKKLYEVSDIIGCMSRANAEYIIEHEPKVSPQKVEICPNSIEIADKSIGYDKRCAVRNKYGIPSDKTVFVYGGNLGKPQGIPFIIECLEKCSDISDAFFLIVGGGTEYHLLDEYAEKSRQANFRLMKSLPKEDYDTMVAACDVGLIFLDHRFTIPNFPSRLLSYMQAKLPVLAATDPNTDIGIVIFDGGFGRWCESNDADRFADIVREFLQCDISSLNTMKENGFKYLEDHYSSEQVYKTIVSHMQ